jgi:diguanylate cyclase (GGDEF)-like protein
MRARPTTTTTTKLARKLPSAKPAKAGLTKTGLTKTGLTKTGLRKSTKNAERGIAKRTIAKRGLAKRSIAKRGTARSRFARTRFGRTGLAKAGMAKLGMGARHRPSTKTLVIAGVATCAVAGVAALPATRRVFRSLTTTWLDRRQQKRRRATVTPIGLDELTGLSNRAEGERMLGAALERGKARGRRVAVLYVDLDDFKLCNDTYGTDACDHVLQVSAARMQAQLRSGDTVCRLGGDDFLVIMESAGPDHTVSRIAERISDAIAQPISFEGETILVGGSVGIAVAVNGESGVDDLIAHADSAVDRARAAGRHVVQY